MASSMIKITILLCIVTLSISHLCYASDSSPLQDFCIADPAAKVNVNGFSCKDAKDVTADDFFFSGLHKAGNTSNPLGSKVTPVFAAQLPGLNTLGISMARIDYAVGGLNPPHLHPRASELLVVFKGTLEVGFVTSFPEFKLFTKVLKMGDVFVFPTGLVHFQRNVGSTEAIALAGLSSQTPGVVPVVSTLFSSMPAINDEVLKKAFQIDATTLGKIQAKF